MKGCAAPGFLKNDRASGERPLPKGASLSGGGEHTIGLVKGAAHMKFGIFYELQLPRPWTPEGEFSLYQNALDQVELADRLGYDFAWEVEHHFLEEYSHSPAPEVFLAAASQ